MDVMNSEYDYECEEHDMSRRRQEEKKKEE